MAAGKPAFAHTEWAGASMAVDPPSQPQTDQRSDCENDKRRSRPVDNWARQVMPHLVRPRISRIGQVTGKCDERLDSITEVGVEGSAARYDGGDLGACKCHDGSPDQGAGRSQDDPGDEIFDRLDLPTRSGRRSCSHRSIIAASVSHRTFS